MQPAFLATFFTSLSRLLGALLPAVLGGCIAISRPPYPGAWAMRVPAAAGCAAICASFAGDGQGATRASTPTLASLLFGPGPHADQVDIDCRTDGLHATARAQGQVVATRNMNAVCDDGAYRVVAPHPSGWLLREGVAAYTDDTVELSAASDGTLVVRTESTGGGLMLGLPAGGSVVAWYRYPRISSTPAVTH